MKSRRLRTNGVLKSSKPEENLLAQLGTPLRAFVKHFQNHSIEAIEQLRLKNPEKYIELSTRLVGLIATLKPEANPLSRAQTVQEIAVGLLKEIGIPEDMMTPAMIESAVQANNVFVAELERIRDAARGTLEQ